MNEKDKVVAKWTDVLNKLTKVKDTLERKKILDENDVECVIEGFFAAMYIADSMTTYVMAKDGGLSNYFDYLANVPKA